MRGKKLEQLDENHERPADDVDAFHVTCVALDVGMIGIGRNATIPPRRALSGSHGQ